MKDVFVLVFALLFYNVSFSQSNLIKNKMIDCLYQDNEIDNQDISYLIKNKDNPRMILFNTNIIYQNCIEGLEIYSFGTSAEGAKRYIYLVDGERSLILGIDFIMELEQNLFYQFFEFYSKDQIKCIYKNVYHKVIDELTSYKPHSVFNTIKIFEE
nr:hypothetical protein [uncultured Flavobacterium sp.]